MLLLEGLSMWNRLNCAEYLHLPHYKTKNKTTTKNAYKAPKTDTSIRTTCMVISYEKVLSKCLIFTI